MKKKPRLFGGGRGKGGKGLGKGGAVRHRKILHSGFGGGGGGFGLSFGAVAVNDVNDSEAEQDRKDGFKIPDSVLYLFVCLCVFVCVCVACMGAWMCWQQKVHQFLRFEV